MALPPRPSRQTAGKSSPDLGRDLEMFELDFAEQPLYRALVDQPGAEMLHGLGAAGDAVAQAVDRRLLEIAGGDIAGEEGITRADRRARLLLVDADAVEHVPPAVADVGVA